MPEAMVEVANLHKAFGSHRVLDGVSFNVPKGAVVALIGASGSGKSTFLRCLNLLHLPDAGDIRVGSKRVNFRPGMKPMTRRELARFRADIGMVFQHFNLFPHMTALQNVMEGPLSVLGVPKREAMDRGRGLLARVGLAEKVDVYPSRLSGGQQQRVAIARALAMNPSVMLCDEVTSALDPELVGEVLEVLENLARGGMTMIIVTHEIAFANEIAHEVCFMSDGQIIESGVPADILLRPQHERTKAFLSRFHRHRLSPAIDGPRQRLVGCCAPARNDLG